jgi:hypothetical protein
LEEIGIPYFSVYHQRTDLLLYLKIQIFPPKPLGYFFLLHRQQLPIPTSLSPIVQLKKGRGGKRTDGRGEDWMNNTKTPNPAAGSGKSQKRGIGMEWAKDKTFK